MRISDWSSDVCSSDLEDKGRSRPLGRKRSGAPAGLTRRQRPGFISSDSGRSFLRSAARERRYWRRLASSASLSSSKRGMPRSEEHTSELQSLMRISYAAFCLKKKKQTYHKNKEYRIYTP